MLGFYNINLYGDRLRHGGATQDLRKKFTYQNLWSSILDVLKKLKASNSVLYSMSASCRALGREFRNDECVVLFVELTSLLPATSSATRTSSLLRIKKRAHVMLQSIKISLSIAF